MTSGKEAEFKGGIPRKLYIGHVDVDQLDQPHTVWRHTTPCWAFSGDVHDFFGSLTRGWLDWYMILIAVRLLYTEYEDYEIRFYREAGVEKVILWLKFPDNNVCELTGNSHEAKWQDFPELELVRDGSLRPSVLPDWADDTHILISRRVALFLAGLYRIRYEESTIHFNWKDGQCAFVDEGLCEAFTEYLMEAIRTGEDSDGLFRHVLRLPDPEPEPVKSTEPACIRILRAYLRTNDVGKVKQELLQLTPEELVDFAVQRLDEIVPFFRGVLGGKE